MPCTSGWKWNFSLLLLTLTIKASFEEDIDGSLDYWDDYEEKPDYEDTNFIENNIIDPEFRNENIVELTLGRIQGSFGEFKTRFGRPIYSFRGIKYAEAPIGDLRFKAPIPVRAWNVTVDATKQGASCYLSTKLQASVLENYSEDCLNLNIYTTTLLNDTDGFLRPVIVYFYGGSIYGHTSQSLSLGPEYLLDSKLVLIVVNYRVGSLGFLSWGDENLPGNYGLKDQVLALRFIKNHIKHFGGDSNKVTIMGNGASALRVGLHLVSPMSKGLFQRIILMSGSPTSTFRYPRHQKKLAIKYAKKFLCPFGTSEKMLQCLRNITASKVTGNFYVPYTDKSRIWKPVIEPRIPGEEQFLTEDPIKLFQEGRYFKVPVIIGLTEFEFSYMAHEIVENRDTQSFWSHDFEAAAAIEFLYNDSLISKEISRNIRFAYLKNFTLDASVVPEFGQMFVDGLSAFPIDRFVNLLAKSNPFPVYYYKFAYRGLLSHFYSLKDNRPIGPVFQDDLMYLLHIPKFPILWAKDPATRTIDRLIKIWSNFAYLGNPTPYIDEITDGVIWEPYTEANQRYVHIHCRLTSRKFIESERFALWNRLFPL